MRDWGLGLGETENGAGPIKRRQDTSLITHTSNIEPVSFSVVIPNLSRFRFCNGPTVATQTTVLPVVSTAQHGSGAAKTSTDVFDTFGETVWSMDAAGYITYTQYDPGLIPNCP